MGSEKPGSERPLSRGPTRVLWLLLGFVSVGVGGVGVLVPGLPTTVFMVIGASCFARSSPRFEKWILNLPGIGPMVGDYRRGLGMPRRAKGSAISMIVVACGISTGMLISHILVRVAVATVGLVGVWFVGWHVPTREQVLGKTRSK
ncbi:MAG: DUF454 family protein [Actinomycetota bacterium]|nr:DUF454 family protein [Actinomycetota bacterium]